MRIVIVPNDLRDAINAKLDAALAECPDATPDREHFYDTLLNYYDEHGCLPEFHLAPKCTCVVSERGVVLRPNPDCPKHRLRVMDEDENERSRMTFEAKLPSDLAQRFIEQLSQAVLEKDELKIDLTITGRFDSPLVVIGVSDPQGWVFETIRKMKIAQVKATQEERKRA